MLRSLIYFSRGTKLLLTKLVECGEVELAKLVKVGDKIETPHHP